MDGILTVSLSLRDMILQLKENAALTPTRRRDLISAVVRLCEIVGVDPRETPASMSYMRPLIRKVHPAKHNLREKTWANLRANFRAAIVHALPRPPRQPNPVWERLRLALPNYTRKRLSRFIGFCEREGIGPEGVCDAVLLRFFDYLEHDAQVTDPRACYRCTCLWWNRSAETVPGWPRIRVSMPNHRRPRRTLPLSSYPPPLQEEVRALLAPPGSGGRFARKNRHKKRLKARTIKKMFVEIELALFALVEAGKDPASLTSLRCLLEPDAFETILDRYCPVDESLPPRPTARNLASTLIGLAKRIPGADAVHPDQIEELRGLQGCLGPQAKRLAEKNRRLLRIFEDPEILEKLLWLPERLAEWAARIGGARGALAMELAVAIAILRHVPLRIRNLAELRIGQELYRPGGPRSPWLIDIPPEQVKNSVPLFYELSQRATPVLDRLISHFRPLRAESGNPYLFPVGSTHKDPHSLSQQIRRAIADWVGIDMTPHQFRHLTGFLWQKHRPGSFAAIAQLLGHKDIETVVAYYAELDTLSASREFDAILEAQFADTRRPRRRS